MSFKDYVLNPGAFRHLTRGALVGLAARMVERAEPCFHGLYEKLPKKSAAIWKRGHKLVVEGISAPVNSAVLYGEVSSIGVTGCRKYESDDEVRGRIINQACNVLMAALEAAAENERVALVKKTIDAGKHLSSIGALLAHAGKIPSKLVPTGVHPSVQTGIVVWDEIRRDLAACIAAIEAETWKDDPTSLGPLWTKKPPTWWPGINPWR